MSPRATLTPLTSLMSSQRPVAYFPDFPHALPDGHWQAHGPL